MNILNRYIYKEFIFPFFTGAVFFTFLLIIPRLRGLVALAFEKNIPIFVVLKLFIYMLPFTMALTIPIGTLFGALFSLGRLSQDSEITAMRANGISLLRIFKPVVFIGVFTTIFVFYFMNYIMTESNLRYKSIYINVIYANPSVVLTPKKFSSLSDNNQKISAAEIDSDGNMASIYIYEKNPENKQVRVIFAERGYWLKNEFNSKQFSLRLYDGQLVRFTEENKDNFERVDFQEMTLNTLKENREIDLASKGLRELTVFEINDIIQNQKTNNQEVDPTTYVEFHKKIAIPMACMAFIILAIPLAVSFQRSGKGMGLGMSMLVILAYQLILNTFEALGKKAVISPIWAMHFPNIITGSIGMIFLLIKTRK